MTRRVPVRDLATQVRGVTYKSAEASVTPQIGTVGVVRAGNIVDGELMNGDLVYVPASRVAEKQWLKRGDVLIAASSGSLDVVGKAARIRRDEEVAFGAFCKVLRPTSEVDAGYFAHFFQSQPYRRHVKRVAAGSNINNLKGRDLDDIEILLPPMEDQRRVAAVLDAAEALRAKRRQALGKLDDLVQAVFVDMFGDPRANGKSILGQHVDVITKGTTPTSVGFQFTESGVPFVRVQDLVTGSVAVNRIELFISEATNEALRRSILKPNDVLISIAGTIGRIALVPEDAPTLNCNQAVALVRTDEDLEPAYLAAWLNTAHAQDQMLGSRVTGTISNLSLANIRSLRLPIPTIDLQRRFADAAADVERLRDALTAHSDSLDTLFASLQQRAFRGEL